MVGEKLDDAFHFGKASYKSGDRTISPVLANIAI
jgi:hypothetical protein